MNYIIIPAGDWQINRVADQVDTVVEGLKGFSGGDLFDGPWIAGGAVRRWLDGSPLTTDTDIDVFSRTDAQFQVIQDNNSGPWDCNKPGSMRLEIRGLKFDIVRQKFDSIGHLFRTFPFTVCQYATDGMYIVTTEQAVEDNENKILRLPDPFVGKLNQEFAAKYIRKGYKPVNKQLEKMIANAPERAEFSGDEVMARSTDF